MVEAVAQIAVDAGTRIMQIRTAGAGNAPSVRFKADASPVTEADLAANEIIVTRLERLGVAPIISEESVSDSASATRSVPTRERMFWLVDPLDGTKDFIAGRDTFVVSIALIADGRPTLGLVYAPALGELFWAEAGRGSFKTLRPDVRDTVRVFNSSARQRLRVLASGSHISPRLQAFLDSLAVEDFHRYGSALKMCRVAEGAADLYPRFGPTSEWDTAAGQIILEEANCKLVEMATGATLRYGKPQFRNPGFVASRVDLDFTAALRPLALEFELDSSKGRK